MRAFVICSVKARLSVLVWGSLDILCSKLITSERVQLSKSISLLSKVVVVSSRLTCLKPSMFIGVSSSSVEVLASPLIGPMGPGVHSVLIVWVSSTISTECTPGPIGPINGDANTSTEDEETPMNIEGFKQVSLDDTTTTFDSSDIDFDSC